MNTIVLDTPRGNVTKRFRHVHPFCPPLRAPTDANPLLLAIEAASEPNSYLLLLINALKGPQKEEDLQQANAENTAEKPSGNKATIVKNTAQLSKIPRHMLSTVPHQIITQQAENTTAT